MTTLLRTTDADGVKVHALNAGVTDLLTLCGAAAWAWSGTLEEAGTKEDIEGTYRDITCGACRSVVDRVLHDFGKKRGRL